MAGRRRNLGNAPIWILVLLQTASALRGSSVSVQRMAAAQKCDSALFGGMAMGWAMEVTAMKCGRKRCNNRIPSTRRSDAKFCSALCQKRESRLRYMKKFTKFLQKSELEVKHAKTKM